MLPQEFKLLPKSKAFILGTGIPPIIADKIIYFEDMAFQRRLLPAPLPDLTQGRSNELLDPEIKEPHSEIAQLSVIVRARPITHEEVADPSTIPANASFDFWDVAVDLEGSPQTALKAWIPDLHRRSGSFRRGGPAARRVSYMNDRRDASEEFSLERQRRAARASAREKGGRRVDSNSPQQAFIAELADSASGPYPSDYYVWFRRVPTRGLARGERAGDGCEGLSTERA